MEENKISANKIAIGAGGYHVPEDFVLKIQRKQWFIDRIGKTIFRSKNTCPCTDCITVYLHGINIMDRTHADYLFLCENELGVKYFDTKKEVEYHEKEVDSKN